MKSSKFYTLSVLLAVKLIKAPPAVWSISPIILVISSTGFPAAILSSLYLEVIIIMNSGIICFVLNNYNENIYQNLNNFPPISYMFKYSSMLIKFISTTARPSWWKFTSSWSLKKGKIFLVIMLTIKTSQKNMWNISYYHLYLTLGHFLVTGSWNLYDYLHKHLKSFAPSKNEILMLIANCLYGF